MQNQVSTTAVFHDASISSTISGTLQLAAAFLLGAVILYGAGFAETSAVHNAAHDTRHATGFPCH